MRTSTVRVWINLPVLKVVRERMPNLRFISFGSQRLSAGLALPKGYRLQHACRRAVREASVIVAQAGLRPTLSGHFLRRRTTRHMKPLAFLMTGVAVTKLLIW
jgi:hypothetical protein